jgi:acetyl-CoA synthetase
MSTFPVNESMAKSAHINAEKYAEMYARSISNNVDFWREQGQRLEWMRPYHSVRRINFDLGSSYINWFGDGQLNASVNCIDRHLATKAEQNAIIWEGDEPGNQEYITYQKLHDEVCRLANGLRKLGVKKGDRVLIYLPMIPQAAYAMLACARIGAVHSVVFAGFSPNAIADRIIDCNACVIITSDQGRRGGRTIPLKDNVDKALARKDVTSIKHNLVYALTGSSVEWNDSMDISYDELIGQCEPVCQPEVMTAEDPLFVLYTSGSTGKPKGLQHSTGGYLVYAAMTHEYVFDYHDGDIYWCAADVGWVTGHSYIIYGPLANGATTIMYEGVPNYPSVNRMSQIVDKYQVNILYTAPTAIRALMAKGQAPIEDTHRNSLRILGSVGEPINPEAWHWYHDTIGKGECPIVDTWWQTETGGIAITPLPGATTLKPGAATKPFFGIEPAIVDSEGKELEGEAEGNLIIKGSWPGQARTIWGDHQRFEQTYFSTYPGVYFTGDGAKRDADGDYWITGRVDDVLNVSGHRLGTAEIESALVAHPAISEAAVVGYPHDIKGQGIYVYVTPCDGFEPTDTLAKALKQCVRDELSPIATPDLIQWTNGLPKTRSGKIMRRILRKIAANDYSNLGDTSTLADPSVVDDLIENRQNK